MIVRLGKKILGLIDLKNEKIVQVIIYSQALAIRDYTSICSHSETLISLISHQLVTFAIFPAFTTPNLLVRMNFAAASAQ